MSEDHGACSLQPRAKKYIDWVRAVVQANLNYPGSILFAIGLESNAMWIWFATDILSFSTSWLQETHVAEVKLEHDQGGPR